MVTSLKFYRRDPNGKKRGKGVYYHRGHGVYSKYSAERDKKIKAKGYGIHKIGLPRKSKTLHTSDGRLKR